MYTFKILEKGNYQDALGIRIRVFVEEQGFHDEIDTLDDAAVHGVLYDGEIPVATARALMLPDGVCKIGRVAVLPEYRGKRLGERIMQSIEQEMRKKDVKRFYVSAQVQASGFYEKIGYEITGEQYLDEHCPHVDMYKDCQ